MYVMNYFVFRLIIGLVLSFLITLYLIPFFIKIANKHCFVDSPDGVIKKQKESVPYLGGLAIFTGFITSCVLIVPAPSSIFLLVPCLTLLLLLGLIDDLVVLKPHQKFFGQFIAALCFLKSILYVNSSFCVDYFHLVLSALWIISLINAFNLIDVMDGLTATVSLGSGLIFFALSLSVQYFDVSLFIVSLLGPVIAFLLYNRPPALMYLGDAGSLFLGGFFATLPFLFPWNFYNPVGFLTPFIILIIPIFELIWLIVIRTWYKIPFYKASSHHFALMLIERNWTKKSILFLITFFLIQIGILSIAFFLQYIDLISLFAALGILPLLTAVALYAH